MIRNTLQKIGVINWLKNRRLSPHHREKYKKVLPAQSEEYVYFFVLSYFKPFLEMFRNLVHSEHG